MLCTYIHTYIVEFIMLTARAMATEHKSVYIVLYRIHDESLDSEA